MESNSDKHRYFGMTWLKDTVGTLVVLEVMWYSAVIEKKPELLMLIFTDLLPLIQLVV